MLVQLDPGHWSVNGPLLYSGTCVMEPVEQCNVCFGYMLVIRHIARPASEVFFESISHFWTYSLHLLCCPSAEM